MNLVPCDGCGRHVRHDDDSCPFCDRRSALGSKALRLVGAVVTPVVLAACYGTSSFDETGDMDNDSDGWTVRNGDCDDQDATVNPAANEICGDTVDNDCDGSVDEAECEAADSGDSGQ